MSFEAFSNDDIQKLLDHTLTVMPEETLKNKLSNTGVKKNTENI